MHAHIVLSYLPNNLTNAQATYKSCPKSYIYKQAINQQS